MALHAGLAVDHVDATPPLAHVQRIKDYILRADPEARFSGPYPAPDQGIWVIDARVSPELKEDWGFREALAGEEVDLMVEHGTHIATLLIERTA